MTQTSPAPDVGPRVTREEIRDLSRLRRATDDKMVAGVAEGLSRHLDIDPLLVRVALGAATFFGGAGLIFYVLAWWTIPADDQYQSIASRQLRRDPERVMTAGLAIAAAAAAITMISTVGITAPHPVPVLVLAVLALIGFAFFSRRSDGAREPREAPRTAAPASPPPASSPVSSPAASSPIGEDPTGPMGSADTTTVMPVAPSAYGATTQEREPAWWRRNSAAGGSGDGGDPLVPGSPPPRRPRAPRRPRSHLFAMTMAAAAIAVGALWIVDETTSADIEPSAYPATVLGLIAAGLIVGAWWGRSRLLILVGILATFATAVSSYAGPGPYGEKIYSPASAAAVQSSYDHGVGKVSLHLEDVSDPENLRGRTIELDSHIGQVEVFVPSSILVAVNAHVDHGDINGLAGVMNGDNGKATVTSTVTNPDATLNVDLELGEIVVHRVTCNADAASPRADESTITLGTEGVNSDAPACN